MQRGNAKKERRKKTQRKRNQVGWLKRVRRINEIKRGIT